MAQEVLDWHAGGLDELDVDVAKANILVVDDYPPNLDAVESILSPLQQKLWKAQSGEEALRCLLKNEFLVILLDVQMPGMDGFETAALIRARETSRHTPIIFVTGISTQGRDVARGYSLGAVDYLFKPYAPDILKSKISVFVDLHKQSQIIARQRERIHRMELYEMKLQEQDRRINYVTRYSRMLQRQARTLQQVCGDLEQFTRIVSHDLKEPLRAMHGYTELLERRLKDRLDPPTIDCIQRILDGADRMQVMIDGILAYSKASQERAESKPVDMGKVLDRTLKGLERQIADAHAVVRHDTLPTIPADQVQMEQLLQNLIQNALKFQSSNPPAIHISARRQEDEWIFEVRDNGIGFDSKDSSKIFSLFGRLHTHAEYPGAGIGLAISRRIVERHGGRIWAESQPGHGSSFYFGLPS